MFTLTDSRTEIDSEARSEGRRLFAETIAAHGGDAFLNLRTLKITGKGEFTTPPQTGGLTVPLPAFTLYIAAGGRSRLDARSPGGPLRFIGRGRDKGAVVVFVGRNLTLPAEQTNHLEPTEFLRAAAREQYPVVTVPDNIPQTTADGKTLLHYAVYRGRDAVTDVFVEPDTKLLRKMVLTTGRGEMTVLLSDYETVSGLPLFGEIHLLENGASIVKLRCQDFVLDEPLKDSLFEI
jgi:hypothetical protein